MSRRAPMPAVACLAAAGLALSSCAGPLETSPAPHADDPDCARVLAALPSTNNSLPTRETTAAGTAAWGADDPVVLFCGVETPGPTTDSCLGVGPPDGAQIDWVVRTRSDGAHFVTFGRSPAIEVFVPRELGTESGPGYLVDLSNAVGLIEASDHCA